MKSAARILFVSFAFVPTLANASAQSDDAEALKIRKYPITKIKKVVIKSAVARDEFNNKTDCSGLKIDAKRVRFFLKYGEPTNSVSYKQNLISGDCSADATVVFENGKAVVVSIDSYTGWGAINVGTRSYFIACNSCVNILDRDFKFDPNDIPDYLR